MKVIHTQDGRKLYKDEFGRWVTAPERDSVQAYSSIIDLKAKPGEVNEFPTEQEMNEYRREQAEKEEQIKAHAEAAKKAKAAEYVEDDIFTAKRPLSKRSKEEVEDDLEEALQYVYAYKEGLLDENPYSTTGSLRYWEDRVSQLKKEFGEIRKRKGFEQKRSWKK